MEMEQRAFVVGMDEPDDKFNTEAACVCKCGCQNKVYVPEEINVGLPSDYLCNDCHYIYKLTAPEIMKHGGSVTPDGNITMDDILPKDGDDALFIGSPVITEHAKHETACQYCGKTVYISDDSEGIMKEHKVNPVTVCSGCSIGAIDKMQEKHPKSTSYIRMTSADGAQTRQLAPEYLKDVIRESNKLADDGAESVDMDDLIHTKPPKPNSNPFGNAPGH